MRRLCSVLIGRWMFCFWRSDEGDCRCSPNSAACVAPLPVDDLFLVVASRALPPPQPSPAAGFALRGRGCTAYGSATVSIAPTIRPLPSPLQDAPASAAGEGWGGGGVGNFDAVAESSADGRHARAVARIAANRSPPPQGEGAELLREQWRLPNHFFAPTPDTGKA